MISTETMQTVGLVFQLVHIVEEAAWTVLLVLASIWLWRHLNLSWPSWGTPPAEPPSDDQGEQGSPVPSDE